MALTTGGERVFKITELKRVGSGATVDYQPTGVVFEWTASNHSIPRGAWAMPVKQRTTRKDYPGSEEPSEQVLGWNYEPFTLSGQWDDRYMGADAAVNTWRAFEQMTQRGAMVRIDFETITITGLITGFVPEYKRASLIGYSFMFSPHFRVRGQSVRTAVPGRKGRLVQDPRNAVNKARQGLEAMKAANALATSANLSRVQGALTTDIYTDVLGDLQEAESYMAKAENVVEGQILSATGTDVANAFGRLAQLMAQAKRTSGAILTRFSSVSALDMSLTSACAVLDFETWRRGICASARAMVLISEGARQEAQARAVAQVKKLHRARQGESLYAISTTYYGTPHRWRLIAERNGLTGLVLAGGELLVIPEVV